MIILDTNVISEVVKPEPAQRCTLATRNAKDFNGTGVSVISPWKT
ncbi:hypothetical protein CAQUA_08255 [Corynebacterium aquatimens]|uniref:Nucleic acid-binding protein n=1 Tax=Corynebacterium aquatimens TaxID=1190508 RepID=A0A931E229_9CORY|nr:putative nucleic acid-binding protein [Corynebacterium aquatimens]WJY66345.1 hypothetical protein CAQUA_08255 [Corynebacterium aquatimens]